MDKEHVSLRLATAAGSLFGYLIKVALITATIAVVATLVAKLVWKLT